MDEPVADETTEGTDADQSADEATEGTDADQSADDAQKEAN